MLLLWWLCIGFILFVWGFLCLFFCLFVLSVAFFLSLEEIRLTQSCSACNDFKDMQTCIADGKGKASTVTAC